ncbi:MAG: calcium-binding protein [Pseudomonadota bacterium]
MANEILVATDPFEFATTLLGRPRNEADGLNQLKEQSGISLGSGMVLTDSRFLTDNNGGPADPVDLTVHRGAGIGGADGGALTADAITELSSTVDELTEIALVRTSDPVGPLIGMVVYADPNEAAGALTMTSYSRADDGAAARAYDFTLDVGSVENVTLKNRTATNDVWLVDYDPAETYLVSGGAGLYQELDIDGDGAGTWYAAGLLVGPYIPSDPSDTRFAVDPIGDIYADLAAELQAAGVDADDIGRNALVASSSGGELQGTYLNEDFLGSAVADTLIGGGGDDFMAGGDGDDSLDSGGQSDTLDGGSGADVLRGRGGADELFGGIGNDRLIGNGGDDLAEGGIGDDTVNGGGGNDTLRGDEGDDRSNGGNGADLIEGGAGDDTLSGGGGADTLEGGADDDRLVGGGGDDSLFGGDGADRLRGSEGADTLTGGGGADRFEFRDDANDVVADFVIGEDLLDARFTSAADIGDLTLTDIALGVVEVSVDGQSMTLQDGDGVADFTAADFSAGDFIF